MREIKAKYNHPNGHIRSKWHDTFDVHIIGLELWKLGCFCFRVTFKKAQKNETKTRFESTLPFLGNEVLLLLFGEFACILFRGHSINLRVFCIEDNNM